MADDMIRDGLEAPDSVKIRVTDNELEAYMTLSPREGGYTVALLRARLKEQGIVTGIQEEVLRQMVEDSIFHEEKLVAIGSEAVNGQDGWFEFFFETDYTDRPKVLADGSVDYSKYGDIPSVDEGEQLAVYHKASESKDGITVYGNLILATRGSNLARLTGRGITLLDDGCTYVSKYAGKITYTEGHINIDSELVIDGDVSNSTGSITYRNDIHVRGNVCAGMSVTSEKGTIIVDGFVESAVLHAGRDVILKNGMQGNEKGIIVAGGNVSGKFFELCTINAGGDVNANAIMNSIISSEESVIVSGRFGIIIGGNISAKRSVSATIIGNTAEAENRIAVGVAGDLVSQLSQCDMQIRRIAEEQVKVQAGIDKITEMMEQQPNHSDLQAKKLLLTRNKIENDSKTCSLEKQRQDIVILIEKASKAKITVTKLIYPGSILTINGITVKIQEVENYVEYQRRGNGVVGSRITN